MGAGQQTVQGPGGKVPMKLRLGGGDGVEVLVTDPKGDPAATVTVHNVAGAKETSTNGQSSREEHATAPKKINLSQLEYFCQAVRTRAQEAGLSATQLETLETFLTLKGQGSWPSLVRQKLCPKEGGVEDSKAQSFEAFCAEVGKTPDDLLPVQGVTALGQLTGRDWDQARRALKEVAHDDPKVQEVLKPVLDKTSNDSARPDGSSQGSEVPQSGAAPDGSASAETSGGAPETNPPPSGSTSEKADVEGPTAEQSNPGPVSIDREAALDALYARFQEAVSPDVALHKEGWAKREFQRLKEAPVEEICEAESLLLGRLDLWKAARELDQGLVVHGSPLWDQIANVTTAEELRVATHSFAVRKEALSILNEMESTSFLNKKQVTDKRALVLCDLDVEAVENGNALNAKRLELWKAAQDIEKGKHGAIKHDLKTTATLEGLGAIGKKISLRLQEQAAATPVPGPGLEGTKPQEGQSDQASNVEGSGPQAAAADEKAKGSGDDAGSKASSGAKEGTKEGTEEGTKEGNGVADGTGNGPTDGPPPTGEGPNAGGPEEEPEPTRGKTGEVDDQIVDLPDWVQALQGEPEGLELGSANNTFRVEPDGTCVLRHVRNGIELEVVVDPEALEGKTQDQVTNDLLLKGYSESATHATDNEYFRHLTLHEAFKVKLLKLDPVAHGAEFKAVGMNLRCINGAELALAVNDSMLKITGEKINFSQFSVRGSSTLNLNCKDANFVEYDIERDVVGVGDIADATFGTGTCQADLVAMNLKGISVQGEFARVWKGTRFDFDKVSDDLFNKKTTKSCDNYAQQKREQNVKAFNDVLVDKEQVARIIRGVSGVTVRSDPSLAPNVTEDALNLVDLKSTDIQLLECTLPAVTDTSLLQSVLLVVPSQGNLSAIENGDLRVLGVVTDPAGSGQVDRAFELNFGKIPDERSGELGIQYHLAKYLEFLSLSDGERRKMLEQYEIDIAATRERRAQQEEEARVAAAAAAAAAEEKQRLDASGAADSGVSRVDDPADSGVAQAESERTAAPSSSEPSTGPVIQSGPGIVEVIKQDGPTSAS